MERQEERDLRVKKALAFSLILVILVSSISVSLYLSLTGILVRSVYVTIPLFLALAYWLWPRQPSVQTKRASTGETRPRIIVLLAATFLLVESISIYISIEVGQRTSTYFLLQGGAAFVLSVQGILLIQARGNLTRLLLLQTGVFVALEVLTKTMLYTMFLGNGDVSFHAFAAQSVMTSGHVTNDLGNYSAFPVYHVLTAMLCDTSGIESAFVGLRVLWGIVAFFFPLAIYTLFGKISSGNVLRIMATVICSTGYLVLSLMGEGLPAVLAFVFFVYILIAGLGSSRRTFSSYMIIGLLLSSALLLIHVVMAGICAILLAIVILSRYGYLSEDQARTSIGMKIVMALSIVFVAYAAFVSLDFYLYLLARPTPTLGEASDTVISSIPSLKTLGISILQRLGLSISIFLFSLAIIRLVRQTNKSSLKTSQLAFGFLGGLAMVLYIPGIFGFAPFLFYYLELERISLYAELAILAMVSVSLSTLANVRTQLGKAGLALIVALLISGGLISPENTSDSQTFATSPVKPTTYLSETDLVAYDVILTNFNERLIETDYFSFTYLRLRDNSCQIAEIGANQSIQFQPGAVVYIRSTELSIHGLSFFPASGVTEISNWTILDSNSEDYRNGVNVLYDFGPSYISEWYAASQISNVD